MDTAYIRKLQHEIANKKALISGLRTQLNRQASKIDRHTIEEEIRRQLNELSQLESLI